MQSLRIAEGTVDMQVTIDDRIQSLVLLTEIWLTLPDVIQTTHPSAGPGILSILKRASRDVKSTLSTVAIQLLFRLLESFATSRNPTASTVYKTLTFLLVEFYWETEIRALMLTHFNALFKEVDIPVEILLEPLLKQVTISQQNSSNVFDFEFFQTVAGLSTLSDQSILMMVEALTKVALSSVFFANLAW